MDGDNEITEADIQALTALGEQEGQILPAEREIIDSLLEFSDRPIKEIMTPRVDVLFVSLPLSMKALTDIVDEKRISRVPVSKTESLDDTFGVVEAVKTVADLFAPVSGNIVETNTLLEESPDLINSDPYGSGWVIKVAIESHEEYENLMSDESYEDFIK